jgi:hypothetical protein
LRSSFTTSPCTVGEFRRNGSSFPITFGFTIPPMIRPINNRGGNLSPSANSNPRAQCSKACAEFMRPHCRSLSGLRHAIRSFTSSTLAASNRFFMSTKSTFRHQYTDLTRNRRTTRKPKDITKIAAITNRKYPATGTAIPAPVHTAR